MPGYRLVARILMIPDDRTELSVVDTSRTEQDISLKQELDSLKKNSGGKMKICHVLGQPEEGWKSKRGKDDAGVLKRSLFKLHAAHNNVTLLSGPPGSIQGVVLPALIDWGYIEDQDFLGILSKH
ncbi:hypothetical protein B0T13DRAFT_84445 [Neurospora crassa]|nr:hypothetical protein B0T13DRAFT_221897 [Neurospora crassa]KAK3490009.1 hypothetical protein B0T13DRAFT_84445 [Neurospora crassa]